VPVETLDLVGSRLQAPLARASESSACFELFATSVLVTPLELSTLFPRTPAVWAFEILAELHLVAARLFGHCFNAPVLRLEAPLRRASEVRASYNLVTTLFDVDRGNVAGARLSSKPNWASEAVARHRLGAACCDTETFQQSCIFLLLITSGASVSRTIHDLVATSEVVIPLNRIVSSFPFVTFGATELRAKLHLLATDVPGTSFERAIVGPEPPPGWTRTGGTVLNGVTTFGLRFPFDLRVVRFVSKAEGACEIEAELHLGTTSVHTEAWKRRGIRLFLPSRWARVVLAESSLHTARVFVLALELL
jgi:hypothetical protein